jgi:hypothetical protein
MPHKWIYILTALLSPLLFWAILAVAARRRPGILPALYPRLRVLYRIVWVCWFALMLAGALAYPHFPWLLRVGWFVSISFPWLILVRDWVTRRIESATTAKES